MLRSAGPSLAEDALQLRGDLRRDVGRQVVADRGEDLLGRVAEPGRLATNAASAARKIPNGKTANRKRYARPAARSGTSSSMACWTTCFGKSSWLGISMRVDETAAGRGARAARRPRRCQVHCSVRFVPDALSHARLDRPRPRRRADPGRRGDRDRRDRDRGVVPARQADALVRRRRAGGDGGRGRARAADRVAGAGPVPVRVRASSCWSRRSWPVPAGDRRAVHGRAAQGVVRAARGPRAGRPRR